LNGGGVDAKSKSAGRSTGVARAQSMPRTGGPDGARIEPGVGAADGRALDVGAGALWDAHATAVHAATATMTVTHDGVRGRAFLLARS
jgi:hypothetical protein